MAHRLDFASRLTLAACEALMNLNGLPAQEVSARPLSTVPISPNSTQVPTEICSGSTQDWNNPCVFLKPGMTFCWSYVRKGADMTHLLSPRQPSMARGGCTSDPPPRTHTPLTPPSPLPSSADDLAPYFMWALNFPDCLSSSVSLFLLTCWLRIKNKFLLTS